MSETVLNLITEININNMFITTNYIDFLSQSHLYINNGQAVTGYCSSGATLVRFVYQSKKNRRNPLKIVK